MERFEAAFRELTGAEHAIAVTNGTVALHLVLHCLGVGPGDEVIVPTFTYIASVNTIAQTGATPVFADSRAEDWLLDPEDVRRRITSRTKAILPVHLYGASCDMAEICRIAREHGLRIVEHCAEALGSTLDNRHVGLFGDAGTFSFYGNKTITTGEGGMVIARDGKLAERLRLVKGQGQSPSRRYWHTELGFNYRMTNLCAAIGLGQIERWNEIFSRKYEIAALYRREAKNIPLTFQKNNLPALRADWLVTCLLPIGCDRDAVMNFMQVQGIETRPTFHCAHLMPMYIQNEKLPIAEAISARGIILPSYPGLLDSDIARVVETLEIAISRNSNC